jgi:PEP-CTERM motif
MNCIRWLLIVAAIATLVAARGALAADVTYTDNVPPLSILSNFSGTDSDLEFEYTAFIQRFDPQLGTLLSVTFDTNFTITFNGSASGTAELSLPYETAWEGMFTTSLPDDSYYFLSLGGPFNMSSTQTASSGPLTNPAILASVTGAGFGQYSIVDVGSSATVNSGFANSDVRDATMSVTYTYTPAVPEPGTVVMAMVGCAGLVGARGRRSKLRR